MRVLVIGGDQKAVKDMQFCLRIRYPDVIVSEAAEGIKGLQLLETEIHDLCLLDGTFNDIEVLDLINRIRDFSRVPLIVISHNDSDLDRSMILEKGADEYINKPFNPIELLAVVRALLRRVNGLDLNMDESFSIANKLTVNFATHDVWLDNKPIKLTPIEFKLLSKMVRNEGRVVTKGALLEAAWGSEYVTETSFVKKYIGRLRSKMEKDPSHPSIFITERGLGYRFVRPL